jgi:hypothetical protein
MICPREVQDSCEVQESCEVQSLEVQSLEVQRLGEMGILKAAPD